MMKKNVFALLLALVLLTGAGPAARAAGRTELYWENSSQTGKIYLDLRELNTSAYGIQLELTLDGSYPDCVFQAENSRYLTFLAFGYTLPILSSSNRLSIHSSQEFLGAI